MWKVWSYGAATEGVGRVYGVGGDPPEHRVISLHGSPSTVDYPPLALIELAAVGRLYQWLNHGEYPDDARLIAAVKMPLLLADAGMLLLVYLAVRRLAGEERARWAALAYWLNPAVVLDGAALGYLDVLFVLPAVGSLFAAAMGSPVFAGALAAAAILTKPQAIVIAPALALAVWRLGGEKGATSRIVRAGAAAVAAATIILVPVLAAGAWRNLANALSRLGRHDMLSANACNLWWIVGHVLRAYSSMHDMGAWAALTAPARILAISRVVELGYPSPRTIGAIATAVVWAWAFWKARHARDPWLVAALAGFVVHAFATLSAQVHENHLFAAVPFLVIAASGRRAFVPVAAAVSAILAANLYLFYGISEDLGFRVPRGLTIVDLTLVVAAVNCAAFVWHARIFSAECSTAGVPRRLPAPA